MDFFKKTKASALQIVVVVAVIILLLLFAFISLLSLQQRLKAKNNNFKEAVYTTQEVFDYLSQIKNAQAQKDSLAFFSTNNKKVTLAKKQWGLFDLLTVRTQIKKEVFQKTGLLGGSNSNRKALYLQNNNNSLIIVGGTKITGDVLLPKFGVNSGNIAGVSYSGNQFIYGEIGQSEAQIPKISNIESVKVFLSNYEKDTLSFLDIEQGTFKTQFFASKTVIHRRNGAVELRGAILKGNIIIESDTLIRVYPSSKLEDVILIAPKIEILKGVHGSFQAFASQSIVVKEHCQLAYPTSLIVFEKKDNIKNKHISILASSHVKGVVGYISDKEQANYKPQVFLDTNVVVFGEVYCQGNLELKGTVNGSVYTNSFIANQSGGVYINHIYNGVINSEKLPEQFSGLFFKENRKTVVKWIE